MVKISLNAATRECIANSSFLGFEGENQANTLVFSFSEQFIDGTAVLNIKRGKDVGFVEVDKVNSTYQLPVKSSLLSKIGDVEFQFVLNKADGTIMKFDSFIMTVEDAIDTDVPLPEEYPTWVEMANVKLAEVDKAIERANTISNQILTDKENGVFDGKDGENGKDGINGTNGKDGVSPVVSTVQTATGAKIMITDANGTHTAEVLNGKDGKDGADGTMSFEDLTEEQKASLKGDKGDAGTDGKDGKDGATGADGYSPTAKVTTTETGAEITITDKNGTTTATITNGKDGSTGADGKDGLTPHIGENGNWWIGEEDTGVSAGGSGASATQTVLFDGDFTTASGTLTLGDNIQNYDIILVNSFMRPSDGKPRTFKVPLVIHTKAVEYSGNEEFNMYATTTTSFNYCYTIRFGFSEDGNSLLTGVITKGTGWTNTIVGIGSVIGIKLKACGSSGSGDGAPIGNIISFMGTIAPEGYLVCDGAELNITDYPNLASHFETQFGTKNHFGGNGTTTFAVPDLRNEFLRGYHGEADKQLSGEIGIHQDGTTIPSFTIPADAKFYSPYPNSVSNYDEATGERDGVFSYTGSINSASTGTTGFIVRPTNIAVLYCIKY